MDLLVAALQQPLALMVIAFSFLMGSVPFGLLFTRGSGIDIRSRGSGNTGATNVLRSVGKKAAVLTLMGDLLKGIAAVALARYLELGTIVEGMSGIFSVIGHDFSIFMRFRGGKGVATSLGVVLIYVPLAGILTCIIWLITVLASRYSSLGALVSFSALPAVVWALDGGSEKLAVSAIITVLLLYKHRANISNLRKGTESKVGQKTS